jgi:hypothetical protein
MKKTKELQDNIHHEVEQLHNIVKHLPKEQIRKLLNYLDVVRNVSFNSAIDESIVNLNNIIYKYEKAENNDAVLCLMDFRNKLKSMRK